MILVELLSYVTEERPRSILEKWETYNHAGFFLIGKSKSVYGMTLAELLSMMPQTFVDK